MTRARVLFVFVLSIAIPSAAVASSAKMAAGIPSCKTLSRTAVANLVGTGPLTLTKMIGPYCYFSGQRPGHYKPMLQIEIIPYIKYVWTAAETAATHSPSEKITHVNSKLFSGTGTVTSAGKSPCQPSQVVSNEPGPACAGQPSESIFTAIGYGSYQPSGQQLMVSTALTGEQGDVHLSHLLALVTEILSAKIH
jgi:hypothetical protein